MGFGQRRSDLGRHGREFPMIALTFLLGSFSAPDPWTLIQQSQLARHTALEAEVSATIWGNAHGREFSHTKTFHLHQDQGQYELRSSGFGPALIQRNGVLTVDGPQGKSKRLRLPPMESFQLERAQRNYQAVFEREETINERPCYVVRLRPLHWAGSGQRLWIDRSTAVVLGRDQYRSDGSITRRMRITELKFLDAAPTPPPTASKPPCDLPKLANLAEASRWLGKPVQLPAALPLGYQMDGFFAESCPDNTHALRMSWSDGLASFSIIVHPPECGRPISPPEPHLLDRVRHWLHFSHGPGPHLPPPMASGQLGDQLEVAAIGDPNRLILASVIESMGTPEYPFRKNSEQPPPPR